MSLRHLALAGCLAASLVTPAAAQQVRELRLGSPWPSASTVHAALPVFAEAVERESKGAIKVRVYPDSQLGDIQSLINGVQLGTVDMTYLAIGNAGVLKGGAPLNVAYVPYLFKSKEGAEKVVNSPVFQELYDNLAKESGVRIFAVYGARSPRAVQNRVRPVTKPEDLKGLKIRIPPIEGIRIAFEKMGAKPVVLGLGDTYNAIERGQVDGHENGIDAAVGYKWYEVAKFFTPTDHIYETGAFYINEKLWQSLTKEEQEIFIKAAKEGGAAMTKAGEKVDAEGAKIFAENGVQVSQPDKAAFEAALTDVYKRLEGRVWPEGLVERIRAIPQ
ncbi:2,3-diketo-L-gulonate-binding periplasmic protein YiaO [Starkeya nomas]|uniref:2,3-diketo-L-gulonate-binding periplasmic protein YiaO n=1 Tax=Starkeya nomas TaxID=2666134 RepID=A0A5S9PBH6_9HYPH|nr:TRAP transporter substrate-binding protein [Starkeya nomas]CAA0101025.1 2,3-diketo-L-gulonate-binding periplasmic protein YiaO [Starkeya nomas]